MQRINLSSSSAVPARPPNISVPLTLQRWSRARCKTLHKNVKKAQQYWASIAPKTMPSADFAKLHLIAIRYSMHHIKEACAKVLCHSAIQTMMCSKVWPTCIGFPLVCAILEFQLLPRVPVPLQLGGNGLNNPHTIFQLWA